MAKTPGKLLSLRKQKVGDSELIIAHEVGADKESKLDVEQRKQRRKDNKAMKLMYQKTRRRKSHGR